MTRILGLGMIALACSGCFHWAPVTSLADIEDDTVRVTSRDSMIVLDHASARGRSIEGSAVEVAGPVELVSDCGRPSCVSVDVSRAHVAARRLNGGATAAIILSTVLGTATIIVALAIAALTAIRPIPDGF